MNEHQKDAIASVFSTQKFNKNQIIHFPFPVTTILVSEILHIVRLDEECPNEAQHFVDVGLDEARLFTCAEAGKVQKFEGSFGQHKVVDTF